MRPELRKVSEDDYWVYGLGETDFDFTLELARRLISSRSAAYMQEAARVRAAQPDLADDILDDEAYYTAVDADYVWHFALWRLQAIFEGLIAYTFLDGRSGRSLIGLKTKLEAMRAAGFELRDSEFDELLAWGRLRNALSHAPPERYRPGPLTEGDVVEYRELVGRLCATWRTQGAGG